MLEGILLFGKLIAMACLVSGVILGGFWFGFKVVDIATGGAVSRIFNNQ